MKAVDFANSPSGKAIKTLEGYTAFVANPLPPEIDYQSIVIPLVEAQQSLGELAGVGRTMANPYLLQRPFFRREAVSSSAIEGTVTTITDLFAYEAGGQRETDATDTREVHNYVLALEEAFAALNEMPISGRLLKRIHVILLRGVRSDRGAKKLPGEYRLTDPAWTDSRLVEEARFVFAPPNIVDDLMADLEQFIDRDTSTKTPDLVKAALIHYQFETVHPFHDGNGRVGRLLIPLYLCSAGILPQPLLFISPYLERNREEYIQRLYDVSRVGAWEEWIAFFLNGVTEQSRDFIIRSGRLLDLQTEYKERLAQARASALLMRLVDMIFERPILSIPNAAEKLDVTYNSAKKNIEKLVDANILRLSDVISGTGGAKLFVAGDVIDLVYGPLDEPAAAAA